VEVADERDQVSKARYERATESIHRYHNNVVADVERQIDMPQMSVIITAVSTLYSPCYRKCVNSPHHLRPGPQEHSLLSFLCTAHTSRTAYSNSLRPSPNYTPSSTRHTAAILVEPTTLFPLRAADSTASHHPSSPPCTPAGSMVSRAAVGMVKPNVAGAYRRQRCRCLPLLRHRRNWSGVW
jgi:hypothetical protein